MQVKPTRMCELLVGLPLASILGRVDELEGPVVHPRRDPSRGNRSLLTFCSKSEKHLWRADDVAWAEAIDMDFRQWADKRRED